MSRMSEVSVSSDSLVLAALVLPGFFTGGFLEEDAEAEAVSSTEIRVMWTAPDPESWNGHLLGYKVGLIYGYFSLFVL